LVAPRPPVRASDVDRDVGGRQILVMSEVMLQTLGVI